MKKIIINGLFLFVASLSFNNLQGQSDIGISAILEPGVPTDNLASIRVTLENFGQDTVRNCMIHTSVNDIEKLPYRYIGPSLAPGKKISLYVSSHFFKQNGTYFMSVWTASPNGSTDTNPANDRFNKTLKGALDLEDLDAGIETIIAPNQILDGANNIRVRLKNFGIEPITNLEIAWRVNGVEQVPYKYVGPTLRTRRTIDLHIGSYRFKEGENYVISARTVSPNGGVDQNTNNDRAAKEYNK